MAAAAAALLVTGCSGVLGGGQPGGARPPGGETGHHRRFAQYVGITTQTAAIVPVPQFQLKADPFTIQRVSDLMLQFGILQRGFSTSQFVR